MPLSVEHAAEIIDRVDIGERTRDGGADGRHGFAGHVNVVFQIDGVAAEIRAGVDHFREINKIGRCGNLIFHNIQRRVQKRADGENVGQVFGNDTARVVADGFLVVHGGGPIPVVGFQIGYAQSCKRGEAGVVHRNGRSGKNCARNICGNRSHHLAGGRAQNRSRGNGDSRAGVGCGNVGIADYVGQIHFPARRVGNGGRGGSFAADHARNGDMADMRSDGPAPCNRADQRGGIPLLGGNRGGNRSIFNCENMGIVRPDRANQSGAGGGRRPRIGEGAGTFHNQIADRETATGADERRGGVSARRGRNGKIFQAMALPIQRSAEADRVFGVCGRIRAAIGNRLP